MAFYYSIRYSTNKDVWAIYRHATVSETGEKESGSSCILVVMICKFVSFFLFCRGLSIWAPSQVFEPVAPPSSATVPPVRPSHISSLPSNPLPSALGSSARPGIQVYPNREIYGYFDLFGDKMLELFLCLKTNGNSLWKTSVLCREGEWEPRWPRIP